MADHQTRQLDVTGNGTLCSSVSCGTLRAHTVLTGSPDDCQAVILYEVPPASLLI